MRPEDDALPAGNLPDEVKTHRIDTYLRLYERQMTHYEKTQEVEWKGSFGIWTLLAAGIALASSTEARSHLGVSASSWWLWMFSPVAAALQWLWLCLVHESEEEDKKLWCEYRNNAVELLGGKKTCYKGRPPGKEMWWQLPGAVVTLLLSGALIWILLHR